MQIALLLSRVSCRLERPNVSCGREWRVVNLPNQLNFKEINIMYLKAEKLVPQLHVLMIRY